MEDQEFVVDESGTDVEHSDAGVEQRREVVVLTLGDRTAEERCHGVVCARNGEAGKTSVIRERGHPSFAGEGIDVEGVG